MPVLVTSSSEILPTQPNVAWHSPRATVYDGSALRNSNIRTVQGSNLRGLETTLAGFSAAPAYSFPSGITADNLIVAFLTWDSTATISAAPSGWTAIAAAITITSGGKTISARGYQKVAATGESQTGAWTLSAAANWAVTFMEVEGCATVSVQDKTNSGTGTALAVSSGLTGTLSQANEIVVGFVVGSTAFVGSVSGYNQVCSISNSGVYASMYEKAVSVTTTTSVAGTLDGTNPWAAIVVTFKGAASTVKFKALGEWDAYKLTATMRAYDLGSFQLVVSGNSPASEYARVGNIIQVTQRSDSANNTFGWYLIQTVDRDETQPDTVITMQGADLRVLIGNRSFKQAVLEATRGTLANYAVENWVRKYITVACISPSGNDYASTDIVPTLALEAASGNRGTVYTTDPPGKGGGTLLDIISSLYRTDRLGWRAVVTGAGTTSGKVEFQTYSSSDRTLGQSNGVVFAIQWDTAETLTVTEDTVGCLTAATVKGPPSDTTPSSRTTFYVEDATSKQRYGLIYGEIDASNEPYLTSTMAAQYLTDWLPRYFLKIKPRQTPLQSFFDNYDLNCKVTALDRSGNRYDSYITEWTVSTEGNSGEIVDPFVGTPDIVHKRVYNPQPYPVVDVEMVVGDMPPVTKEDAARAKEPPEVKDYTLLKSYSGTGTTLNYLVGVTPGTATLSKAVILDSSANVTGLGLTTPTITSPSVNGSTLSKTGTEIGNTVDKVNPVTPGTTTASKALVVGASKETDALTVTNLKAGAGSNGNIADGATRNPQQAAIADTSGATVPAIETEVNSIKAALRAAGIIAT